MTEEKKRTATVLAVVLVVAILCSLCASLYSAKGIYDLKTEANAAQETTEDNVKIMNGEYEILSTTQISDAYKSGNTSGLSEKDQETLEMAKTVLEEVITDDMTTAYDKEKAIYDWMTSKLNYDTGVLQVIPQTSADCDKPYGVLKYHNAVCVGYATTFRLFMQMLDIPCMVVHNTEKYHSWDLVQLDGDWYHVDIYSDQNGSSYANFNMNDELAGQTHDWDRDFFPAAASLKYNYGYQNKQPVKDIYSIPKMIRQALEDKQGCLFLDFETIDEEHAQIVEAMLSGVQLLHEYAPRLRDDVEQLDLDPRHRQQNMSWPTSSKATTTRNSPASSSPMRNRPRSRMPSTASSGKTWTGPPFKRSWKTTTTPAVRPPSTLPVRPPLTLRRADQ
ncbi:MAG: transglutaminase domain-containing protein [Evtepia sp.]